MKGQDGHGHHVICQECHRAVEFAGCDMEAVIAAVQVADGLCGAGPLVGDVRAVPFVSGEIIVRVLQFVWWPVLLVARAGRGLRGAGGFVPGGAAAIPGAALQGAGGRDVPRRYRPERRRRAA